MIRIAGNRNHGDMNVSGLDEDQSQCVGKTMAVCMKG